MLVNSPVYGDAINLRCAVYDSATTSWVEVLGASTRVSSTRGGNVGVAGIASVELGTLSINILDIYDPSKVDLLSPNQPIVLYIDDDSVFTDPMTDGAIFTGNIQDISTEYFYEMGAQHVNVQVYAADAVSSHTGITVEGFEGTTLNGVANTASGYQRWEDRINDLSTQYAKTTVPTVIISAPVPIYSI